MAHTVQSLFKQHARHIKITPALAKEISRYVHRFANKDDDSINYLGNPYIGVYSFRYTKEDNNTWFDDILEIDDVALQTDIRELPSIDNNWKVASNATNLSYIWLIHSLHVSTLSERIKSQTMIDVAMMLQYKFLSSLDAHFFKYPADKSIAIATYAALSKKYAIKQHGSWFKVIKARAVDLLSKDSIHYKTYTTLAPDSGIVYMLNDTQGRHRDAYKRMTEVFYDVKEADSRIMSTSSHVEIDGEAIVRDKSNDFVAYRQYIHEVIPNRDTFIKSTLTDIIERSIGACPPKALEESLVYASDNYRARRCGYIEELLTELIIHACNFLVERQIAINDLVTVMNRLRSMYMASKVTDESLIKIRDWSQKLIKDSVSSRNATVQSASRSAFCMYVVLRTLTKKQYA